MGHNFYFARLKVILVENHNFQAGFMGHNFFSRALAGFMGHNFFSRAPAEFMGHIFFRVRWLDLWVIFFFALAQEIWSEFMGHNFFSREIKIK